MERDVAQLSVALRTMLNGGPQYTRAQSQRETYLATGQIRVVAHEHAADAEVADVALAGVVVAKLHRDAEVSVLAPGVSPGVIP